MTNYEYRIVDPAADVTRYSKLFSEAFGAAAGKITPSYLRWLYHGCPHGSVIAVDAIAEEEVVAHYAVVPRDYIDGDGERVRMALSLNTATHPDHQGKGLFTKLAERTFALAAQRGCEAIIGIANANSTHGFVNKLGFCKLGSVRLRASLNFAPNLLMRPVAAAYDVDFLRWRLANPSRRYRLIPKGEDVVIQTRLRHVPVILGMMPRRSMPSEMVLGRRTATACIGVMPYFAGHVGAGIDVPKAYQPSPWNVIVRYLGMRQKMDQLQVHGLDMDTF